MKKYYTFSEFKTVISPSSGMWDKIKRDITHLPQDAIDSIEEWKDMYDKYAGGGDTIGERITNSAKNSVMDILGDILTGIWEFVYTYGYWILLFVGVGAILLYACGHRGALKWTWTSLLLYLIICAMGGLL